MAYLLVGTKRLISASISKKKSVCVICISAHPASSGYVLKDVFFKVM